MRSKILFITLVFLILACNSEKINIKNIYLDPNLLEKYNNFIKKDTLTFVDKKGDLYLFISEKLDTTVIKKGFLAPRPQINITKKYRLINSKNSKLNFSYTLFRYLKYEGTSIIIDINNQFSIIDSI